MRTARRIAKIESIKVGSSNLGRPVFSIFIVHEGKLYEFIVSPTPVLAYMRRNDIRDITHLIGKNMSLDVTKGKMKFKRII